jgi:hypothetical protein
MFTSLGPIDVCCEAPEYPIVEACKQLGFRSPWDVRWLHRSRLREEVVAKPGRE